MVCKLFSDDFFSLLVSYYGKPTADDLLDALRQEPVVSVRMREGVRPLSEDPVPWCPLGCYLSERPRFLLDPRMHAGMYYVQEASSMFLWHALRQLPSPRRVLDLCASPGGKSTLLLSAIPPEAILVSNEAIASRTGALVENISKWGHANVLVSHAPTSAFRQLPDTFDLILTDVPCSGEGMFRKSEEAVRQWSMEKVRRLQALQRQIVGDAWQCLSAGGYLIYSTCTFNPLEDEDNVAWIAETLGGETVDLHPPSSWHILPSLHTGHFGYHFLPGRVRGEGFFLSVIRKSGHTEREGKSTVQHSSCLMPHLRATARVAPTRNEFRRMDSSFLIPNSSLDIADWWTRGEGLILVPDARDQLCLFPSAHLPLLEALRHQRLPLLQIGTPIAEEKGKGKWKPLPPLALSHHLRWEAFPQVDLPLAQAIDYLRGLSLPLDEPLPKGYVLATYEGHPLGFLHPVGGRANNLYPTPWRIRQYS